MGKKNYINNKELYLEIVKFHSNYKDNDNERISDYIGKAIVLICNNLSKKPNFCGYSFKEEMVLDAICDCVYSVKGFNIEKNNNPFAYFTQTAWNAFLRRIEKESKQNALKHKNLINLQINIEVVDKCDSSILNNNQVSDEIVKNYENKLTERKKRSKIGSKFNRSNETNEKRTLSAGCN